MHQPDSEVTPRPSTPVLGHEEHFEKERIWFELKQKKEEAMYFNPNEAAAFVEDVEINQASRRKARLGRLTDGIFACALKATTPTSITELPHEADDAGRSFGQN